MIFLTCAGRHGFNIEANCMSTERSDYGDMQCAYRSVIISVKNQTKIIWLSVAGYFSKCLFLELVENCRLSPFKIPLLSPLIYSNAIFSNSF